MLYSVNPMASEILHVQQQLQEDEYRQRGAYHRMDLSPGGGTSNVLYSHALSMLPDNLSGQRFLDYGGGDAAMGTLIAQRGSKSFVFDLSSLALSFAKNADPTLSLTQGKTTLPFRDASFDTVAMLEVLEHLPDDQESIALDEVNRVLPKGGTLIISVPSINVEVLDKHYRHYSLEEIIAKLNSRGFDINETFSILSNKQSYPAKLNPLVSFLKSHPALYKYAVIIWRNTLKKHVVESCESAVATDYILSAIKL